MSRGVCEKGVPRNFTKFTGKHLRPQACNFIKKQTLAQVFSCEFCEISRNNFLKRTSLVAALNVFFLVWFLLYGSTSAQFQLFTKPSKVVYNVDHDFEIRWKFFRELFFSYFKIIITFTFRHTDPLNIKRKGTKMWDRLAINIFSFYVIIHKLSK